MQQATIPDIIPSTRQLFTEKCVIIITFRFPHLYQRQYCPLVLKIRSPLHMCVCIRGGKHLHICVNAFIACPRQCDENPIHIGQFYETIMTNKYCS